MKIQNLKTKMKGADPAKQRIRRNPKQMRT